MKKLLMGNEAIGLADVYKRQILDGKEEECCLE